MRSHLLNPLPVDGANLEAAIRDLARLDLSRYMRIVIKLPSLLAVDGTDSASLNEPGDVLDHLRHNFPSPRRRDRLHARQLALDLDLSRTVLFSEEISAHLERDPNHTRPPVETAGTPEDEFARATGQLSLHEREPPAITFSLLAPRTQAAPAYSDTDTSLPTRDDGPTKWAQGRTTRTLMAEWEIGADPRAYEWKGWREVSQNESTSSGTSRPIRPDPSPRTAQTTFGIPAMTNSPAPFRKPIVNNAADLPQSSPLPARITESNGASQLVSNTQVERGPYGSRTAVAGKKKVKKRVGGF